MNWRDNLIEDRADLDAMIEDSQTIAVLGIKPESRRDQPAFYVPEFLAERGHDVIPVPVYYPEVTEILGRPVERDLRSLSKPVDMINVFRRPSDIDQHVDDILAAAPKYVWFQRGIRNDAAAEAFARAGIKVVQDRCLLVEARRTTR